MKNKSERRLTMKQRKWIKKYIETGNATEAAMQVYDCKTRDSAEVIGSENLGKLRFDALMDEMGLTDVALLNVGAEGMTQANKIHGTGDNFVEIPDYAVRHKYWETILKLKKRLGPDTQVNQQFNAQEMTLEFIQDDNFIGEDESKITQRAI